MASLPIFKTDRIMPRPKVSCTTMSPLRKSGSAACVLRVWKESVHALGARGCGCCFWSKRLGGSDFLPVRSSGGISLIKREGRFTDVRP